MESNHILGRWFRRNWPLPVTGAVLFVGVGVLLMRSSVYDRPPTAEAAVVVAPGKAVIVPGRATVVVPSDETRASSALVSETHKIE